jgi:hypothetical protein
LLTTYNFVEWLENLTCGERAALTAYKDETENLKRLLLGKDQQQALSSTGRVWTMDDVAALDSAVSKLINLAPVKLWCAVADGRNVRSAIADGVYHFAAHISASATETAAYSFFSGAVIYDPILLEFDMRENFLAARLPLREGAGDGEYERILPRNTPYKIVASRTIPFSEVRPDIKRAAGQVVTVLRLAPIPAEPVF